MKSLPRLIPLLLVLAWTPALVSCAENKPKPKHNWTNYEHYEDNDSNYTAPQGFGFCGGEMAICE